MVRLPAIILLFASASPCLAAPCTSLAALSLPDTTITLAYAVGANQWNSPNPAFCRVTATLKPTSDSDIKIEVWMPEADWNGKYLAVGNGGWSGAINERGMLGALQLGYATSSTDTGHEGSSAAFALHHPQKLIDYAYRSEHEMTVKAKAIIAAYYAAGPRLSYWNGCSAGGKQGLQEAQRYPQDYDGIIAGAPAANWIGRATQSIWVAQAVHKDAASFIPPGKYAYLHGAVLAACDALDGVADGVIENPQRCKFDPKIWECPSGVDRPDCLTPPQVEAARKIYSPSVNPRTKRRLYAGLYPGSELGWGTWGGLKPLSIGFDYFRYVVFEDPDWDFRKLNFDSDVALAEKLDANRINATDPNLQPFFARGGKIIQYHGWSDPQISPGNSVDYYQSVLEHLGAGEVSRSYRLFMVPGMGHCGGGDGASSFDMVTALEKWVEEKHAPERIIASRNRNGRPELTHPLCPYPQTAVYQGKGNTSDEANFVCKP
jgi:feruloyl esterase